MTDEKKEDTSSNPFSVRSGIPFVFLPSAFTTDFNFSSNHRHTHASTNDEPSEEKKEIQTEETIDEDETDRNSEKNDVRISQPKYSQLLKELDFSRTRMVDVTNLLSNELDQQNEYFSSEENESPKKKTNKSSTTSDDDFDDQISNDNNNNNNNNSETDNNKIKDEKDLANAEREIQDDLNNLAAIIQAAAELSGNDNSEETPDATPKKPTFDEDDDTSKQATQNYDLHDNEQEDIVPSTKSSKIPRLIKQNSNTTRNEPKSIVTSVDFNKEKENQIINQENKHEEEEGDQIEFLSWDKLVPKNEQIIPPIVEVQQEESKDSSDKQSKPLEPSVFKTAYSTSSSSSDTDSIVQQNLSQENQANPPEIVPLLNIPIQTNRQDSQETLIDENLDDFSSQLKQVLIEHERQTVNANRKEEHVSMSFPLSTSDEPRRSREDLLRHSSNQRQRNSIENLEQPSNLTRKKSHHHRHSSSRNVRKHDDDWLTMLEKLEREHRARLEKQQQEYENYMHTLEEKMKQRFDDYLTLTNGFQESRLDDYNDANHHHHHSRFNHRIHTSIPIDSNIGRYKTHTHTHPYRPLADDLISHYYPADSTLNILSTDRKPTQTTNMPKSESKEDISNFQTDLSAKHAKHIADLKLYYEYEINDLKGQLNRLRMGHTSSSTRQSIETIERINSENIRLHDEINDLRHSMKTIDDENKLLKRQIEELREQLKNKDIELKTYHRTIADLEQQLTEAENTKERQDEKSRHADRQVSLYRDENENLKIDLNFARERLLRLEERFREQETENEQLRRQLFLLEGDSNRSSKSRLTDDHKMSTAMNFNMPTSRDYGRLPLSTTKPSPSPRDTNLPFSRYQLTTNENYLRHDHSPRRITDYLNEKPSFPQPYVSPSRNVFSPRKTSPTRRRVEPMSTRNSTDRQSKQIEQKFDQLLKKKRDLETRLSHIPLRPLTATDRQLSDVLEREIERVEQQISSVKLELRKLNVFHP